MSTNPASSARAALVTGAAGFIGAHLVRRLVDEGWKVTGLDVSEPPASLPPGVAWLRADIRNAARVAPALEGVDVLFHLASLHLAVDVPESEYRAVNVDASGQLVALAAQRGVRRFVHTSSVGIYGDVERPPADEATPPRPENPYERTKLEGEASVRRRASEETVELIVLRPAWAYGPGCPRTAKLFDALRSGRFFYIGPGDNLRHPVYVDEVVDAYLLAASPEAPGDGSPYIVAGPRYMPLREMVEAFARAAGVPPPRRTVPVALGWAAGWVAELAGRLTGREPPLSRRTLAFFTHDNAYSTGAARRDLDYRPTVELEDGLRRTLAASPDGRARTGVTDEAPVPAAPASSPGPARRPSKNPTRREPHAS